MPNPIAVTIMGIEIRWYGILIATGMLIAGAISYCRAERFSVKKDKIIDIILISIPIGIIGARLYYVIFQWDYYKDNLSEIINVRNGGLAIHGGLIFGMGTAYIMCRLKKINFFDLLDLVIPSVALAQAIGRWGNFFNGEAHGGPTDLPWAITVNGEKVHPTFLYESIWCILLFVFLIWISRRRKFKGQILMLYGMLYSLERFFVEGLRTDSLMIGMFRQGQVISLLIAICSIIGYVILAKKEKYRKDFK